MFRAFLYAALGSTAITAENAENAENFFYYSVCRKIQKIVVKFTASLIAIAAFPHHPRFRVFRG
jgi:hypothetical protein